MKGIAQEASPLAMTATAAHNKKIWQDEIARLQELSALQAQMMAREMGDDDAAHGESAALRQELPYLFEEQPSPALHGVQLSERLAFCRTWLQKHPRPTSDTSLDTLGKAALVSCLDSPLFLDAHKHFTELLPNAKCHPAATFAEIIDEVAVGNVSFGILPIENAEDGKLFRFYEQIERHELHIFATRSVTLGEGEEQTRLALISKAPPPLPKSLEKVMECVVFEEDAFSLCDVLFIAASCGIALRRIDSLPASFGKGHFLHHPIFCSRDGDFDLFCTYLDLFMPRTIITAHYINLKG